MNTMQLVFPVFLLLALGLIAWFGTRFAYDLVSKMFTPIEPDKQPLNEKDSDKRIVRHPITGTDYIETTTTIRGGRGNPKLLQFTSYEERE